MATGFRQGRYSEITVSGINISAYLDSIEFSREAELLETTTFTKTSKTWLPGLQDGTVDIAGKYERSSTAGMPGVLLPLLLNGGDSVQVKYFPAGQATGELFRQFNGIVVGFNESSEVGDVVAFNASIQIDGAVQYVVSGA